MPDIQGTSTFSVELNCAFGAFAMWSDWIIKTMSSYSDAVHTMTLVIYSVFASIGVGSYHIDIVVDLRLAAMP